MISAANPAITQTQSNPAIPFWPQNMVHAIVVQGKKINPKMGTIKDWNAKLKRFRPLGNSQKINKPNRGPKKYITKTEQHIASSSFYFMVSIQPGLKELPQTYRFIKIYAYQMAH
jgi:hypothetical protein